MNRLGRSWVLLLLSLSPLSITIGQAADLKPTLTQATLTLQTKFTPCQEPRPDICYESIAPVCAIFQTQLNHTTLGNTLSTSQRTFMNDCKACADNQVRGFLQGACP